MSSFAELPSHRINFPIGDFRPAPPRPVVPTAALAAQLAQTIGQVAENLNPEQRKIKEMQIAVLGNKVISDRQSQEMNELNLKMMRDNMSAIQKENQGVQGAFQKAFGRQPSTRNPAVGPMPPLNVPTTTPHDYYRDESDLSTLGFSLSPEQESSQSAESEQEIATPDEEVPELPTDETELS